MERALELRLLDQALDQLVRRTTHMSDRCGSESVSRYVSRGRYEEEVGVLHRHFPLGLAHSSELPQPGSYVLRTVAGLALILIRGPDGKVRAFLNSCRHRGAKLLDQCKGTAAHIVCPYHAWSYRNDGSLAGIPGPEGFADVDRKTLGLIEFPSCERYGLIWTVPHRTSVPDWDTWFAPVDRELIDLGLRNHSVFYSREVELDANWKTVNDAFMEGYHFRFVHRDSVFPMYFDNQGVFDALGPHYRYFLPHQSISSLTEATREQWSLRKHCLMVYQLFPTTTVQVLPDHVFVHQLIPISPTRSLVRNIMLVSELPTTENSVRHWETNRDLVLRALDEDHAIAERVQKGLNAEVGDDVVFGRYEQGIVHMHQQVDDALRGALAMPQFPDNTLRTHA